MTSLEEAEKDLENVCFRLEEKLVSRRKALFLKSVLDGLLPFVSVAVLFLVLSGLGFSSIPGFLADLVGFLNWMVIFYFLARLGLGVRLASSEFEYLKRHWLDFALVIPAFTFLKEFQVLRLLDETLIDGEGLEGFLASSNAGFFTRLTRIVRGVKKAL